MLLEVSTSVPFMSASYFAIQDVTTVSLLRPSISGSSRIFFSAWCLETKGFGAWLGDQEQCGDVICSFPSFLCQIWAYYACFAPSSTAKHSFFVREKGLWCTSLRDLMKDTLLMDRKRRKKPSTWRELKPRPQEFCSAGMNSITAPCSPA